MDNNCDGTADEGCSCINGDTQTCGSDVGECQSGIQTCSSGSWGACVGEIAPTAEICDGLDNNCDGTADEGCDIASPQIVSFNIQSRDIIDPVTVEWIVTDDSALKQVELWRAPDNIGNPGTWAQINTQTVSGVYAEGQFIDTPSVGSWWYGLHAVDQVGNWAVELSPLGPIQMACADNDNDGYDNCNIGDTGDDGNPIDCDDNEPWANPGGTETCDTVDNNCNGQTDEGCDGDNDGYCDNAMLIYSNNSMCPSTVFTGDGMSGDDCDDNEANINPGIAEICYNSIDDNCDLDIDCVDAGCAAHPSCIVDCSDNGSNDAEFVSQTVPVNMSPGQEYAVSITIKNTGTSIWTRTCDFRLGSQSSQDNLMWGFRRVDLGGDDMIAPNETKTFIFNVTAPLTPGTYDFQWRMLRESVEWFGERTLFQIINVF